MLTLSHSSEPVWLEPKPGVRLHMRPVGSPAWQFASRAAARALTDAEDPMASERSGFAFTIAAVQFGLIAWEGVGDNDGAAIPPTAARIAQLLEQDPDILRFLDIEYVGPAVERRLEGNGFAPSPSGSSATAPATAPRARAGAKTARKTSTRRKPSKAS